MPDDLKYSTNYCRKAVSFSDDFLPVFVFMAAKLKLPITKKGSPSKQIDELILSIYQVQLRRVLISIFLRPSKKETAPSVISKITTISLNSFFSQNRDGSFLVNRSKTGVIVNLRRGYLTSVCD